MSVHPYVRPVPCTTWFLSFEADFFLSYNGPEMTHWWKNVLRTGASLAHLLYCVRNSQEILLNTTILLQKVLKIPIFFPKIYSGVVDNPLALYPGVPGSIPGFSNLLDATHGCGSISKMTLASRILALLKSSLIAWATCSTVSISYTEALSTHSIVLHRKLWK